MSETLLGDHQALREQLHEFGIDSYIVGQNIGNSETHYIMEEIDYACADPTVAVVEREIHRWPFWEEIVELERARVPGEPWYEYIKPREKIAINIGARYCITKYLEDPLPSVRQLVVSWAFYNEEHPEADALHTIYVPLDK